MRRYFKERAWLSGLQASLDAVVAYVLWGLQVVAVAGLLIFVWMGAQLVIESQRIFAVSSQEAQNALPKLTPKNEIITNRAGTEKVSEREALPSIESQPPKVSPLQSTLDMAHKPSASGVDNSETNRSMEALHVAFQGLEFLLFAPLSFLLLRSLTQYVVDLTMKECEYKDLSSDENGESQKGQDSRNRSDVGKQSLLDAKTLSIGLLFAIVATHLVGRLLSGKYSASADVSWKELIIGLGLLVFLAAAYLCMELITHKPSRRDSHT